MRSDQKPRANGPHDTAADAPTNQMTPAATYVASRDRGSTVETETREPVLITTREVMLGTATALRARRTLIHHWTEVGFTFFSSVYRMITTSRPGLRAERRHYPKQYAFLERSCMSREMDRL
jgi:hypothetical protein